MDMDIDQSRQHRQAAPVVLGHARRGSRREAPVADAQAAAGILARDGIDAAHVIEAEGGTGASHFFRRIQGVTRKVAREGDGSATSAASAAASGSTGSVCLCVSI